MTGIRFNFLKCATLVAAWILAVPAFAQDAAVLNTKQEKDSYAVGVDLARNLKRRGVKMESEALLRGMRDVISGQKLLMTEDDLRATLNAVQVEERQKRMLSQPGAAPLADDNAAKGAAFLAQNKTNQGVATLPSGLQYKILKNGTGPKPSATDTIECNFRGLFIDGNQFAGSDPAKPGTFKLSDVVPGLREALQLMPVGSKWQVFIPPQLGYGEKGVGRSRLAPGIGPNTTLIYELELLAIK
jgi:UDP-GlcNAc:undecaprenyl-phosphate/decaprenyl-phosphate GlcNAc-1-phosphate transferase